MHLSLAVFIGTLAIAQSVTLSFHTANRRFEENHYDYYFSCQACCGTLAWKIKGCAEGGFSYDFKNDEVSRVKSVTSPTDGRIIEIKAILLKKSKENECLTSILFVTCPTNKTMEVKCVGSQSSQNLSTQDINLNFTEQRNGSGVKIEQVLQGASIVNDYYTHIFLCKATGSVSWLVNGTVVGKYTDVQGGENDDNGMPHPPGREVAYTRTILVDSLTAILVLSDYKSEKTDTVTCLSQSGNVSFPVWDTSTEPNSTAMPTDASSTMPPGNCPATTTTTNDSSTLKANQFGRSAIFLLIIILIL